MLKEMKRSIQVNESITDIMARVQTEASIFKDQKSKTINHWAETSLMPTKSRAMNVTQSLFSSSPKPKDKFMTK